MDRRQALLNAALTCLVLASNACDDEPLASGAAGHAAAGHEPAAGTGGSDAAGAPAAGSGMIAAAGAGGESLCG